MATLFLCILWSVMLVKTFLVADNVSERHGHAAIMRWLSAQWKFPRESSELPTTTHRLGNGNASRFRPLHAYLLLAHVTACFATGASLVRSSATPTCYMCRVTYGIHIFMAILYQTWIILFLEAKTEVTRMSGPESSRGPCWERYVKGFARFWSWVFTPVSALLAAIVVKYDPLDDEGSRCHTHDQDELYGSEEAVKGLMAWFSLGLAMQIVLLVLLLAIFIMPLTSFRWAGATLGISYRRVIVRNILCAAGITAVITARIVVVNLLMVNNRFIEFVRHEGIIHTSSALVELLSLIFMEITLEMGFTSCFSTFKGEGEKARNVLPDEQGELPGTTSNEISPPAQQVVWASFSHSNPGPRTASSNHPESPASDMLDERY